jgi:molybdopterin-guanine dinucleotide biosynthesis protein A/uridine kinase
MRLAAVVLAGGESQRFGADKLAADLGSLTLLERAVSELPAQAHLIIVGAKREIGRPATFAREEPPGTGPAAGLVAGLRAALSSDTEAIVVLPGDAPAAGRAAMALLSALQSSSAGAVVAVDTSGRAQPLQLALRPTAAKALIAAAGKSGAAGHSARRLIERLSPPAQRVPVSAEDHFDIDTADQLLAWQQRDSPGVQAVLDVLDAHGSTPSGRHSSAPGCDRPYVIAIDGASGAGKSTLAAALALRTGATVIDSDDFYSAHLPGLDQAAREAMSDAEAAASIIDWRRLRAEALVPLSHRRAARYAPLDWEAYDGSLGAPKTVGAADVVIVEGVYSARPELADMVDLRVLLEVPADVRLRRLADQPDPVDRTRFWDRAEQHYFSEICPPHSFDLRLSAAQLGNGQHA